MLSNDKMQVLLRRSRRRIDRAGFLLCCLLGIAACGGGGGSDELEYRGNRNAAAISSANATAIAANLFDFGRVATSLSAAKPAAAVGAPGGGPALLNIGPRFALQLRRALGSASAPAARITDPVARTEIDDTVSCAGGRILIRGEIEDDGTGNLTMDYQRCREGGITIDGEVDADIRQFDFAFGVPTDVRFEFSSLTVSTAGYSVTVDGTLRSVLNLINFSENVSVSRLVGRDNRTRRMIMIENQRSTILYDDIFFPSSHAETTSGRIFDSVHGYVDFDTVLTLNFVTDQQFPSSGLVMLVGGGGASIRVIVSSNSTLTLELDLDGDSAYESAFELTWLQLVGGYDLGDSDGDGMLDGWETDNGLDPGDPGDADSDADGDGFSALEEYLSGTDPNDGASMPPTTDLEISSVFSPSAVVLGGNSTHTVTVRNNGTAEAADVVVTDVLAAGLVPVSATPDQGNCSLAQTLVCNLGTLPGLSQATIAVVTGTTGEGSFDSTASVDSATRDSNPGNDSAVASLFVGAASTGIQGRIDAATDGDTITVDPGIYVGTLDFNGKAITLTSTGGALVTVIDGGATAEPVVTFASGEGNDSVLDGFTIRNGGDRGIYVASSSPTIRNNIVEDNSGCTGAGIELAFSSAVVRQNIIRGNFKAGCSGGTGGGGILIGGAGAAMILDNRILDNSSTEGGGISLFAAGTPTIRGNTISGNSGGAMWLVNFSDALIVNNVIANNTDDDCGGIDWLVPSGNDGPRVINNTFAGNDGARGSAICADGFDAKAEIFNNTIVAPAGRTAIYCGDFNDTNNPVIGFNNVTVAGGGTLYGGLCGDQTGVNGNLSADPLFVDAAAEDYRLGAGSPSIDAGDGTLAGLPATDIDGNDRVIDGDSNGIADIDIGAHEYRP